MFSSLFIKLSLAAIGSIGIGTGGYFVYKTFFKETDLSQISKVGVTDGDSTSSKLSVPGEGDSSNTTTTPPGGSQINEGSTVPGASTSPGTLGSSGGTT